MVAATVMNSVRQTAKQKFWTISDFVAGGEPQQQHEPRIRSAEEILQMLMEKMPPTKQ